MTDFLENSISAAPSPTRLEISGDCEGNHLAILLDDAPPATLALKCGLHTYEIAVNLAEGEHTVSLFKQTEAIRMETGWRERKE